METLAARLLDVTIDDNENPITGLNKEPLVPFEAALAHWQQQDKKEMDEDDIALAVDCALLAAQKRKTKNPADPLSLDQIAAIHIYTQESPVYHALNARMRDRDRAALKPAFPYLKLFLTALYSLTPLTGINVYRGIKKDLSAKFADGSTHLWWAFSSTTRKVNVLENPMFLGTDGARTMLHIAACTAYDISMYSAINSEQELLLPPGTKLTVEGNMSPAKDLYMVQMKQLPYRPLFTVDSAGAAAASSKGGAAAAASPAASLPSPPSKGAAPTTPRSAAALPPAPAAKAVAKPVHPRIEKTKGEIRGGSTVVDLNGADIGDDDVRALVDFLLQTKTSLTELRLGDNKITAVGARALAEYLGTITSLTQLFLANNTGIGDDGVCAVARSLKGSTQLGTLVLVNTRMSAVGARALAEYLGTISNLTYLGLESNSIGDDGVCAVARGLKGNTRLEKLWLYNTSISAVGARALAEYLGTITSLTALSLSNNSIGDDGVCAVARSLKGNTRLGDLRLEGNSISAVGACALAEYLGTITSLTSLNVQRNPLGAGKQVLQAFAAGRPGLNFIF